jgi:SAM-dependent methyltransferase
VKDSTKRFSSRVENYVKYRPGYPSEIMGLLREECGLTPDSVIADVGSGTGLLARLFVENGNRVYGIEPNREMREAGEAFLAGYDNFASVEGRADETTLPDSHVDFVTAGQAFHWFDVAPTRKEFARILKAEGWVLLIWNSRDMESTSFLRGYEQLLLEYGTDYSAVRHRELSDDELRDFFDPGTFHVAHFENKQRFDLEGLTGRLLSSSYTPETGHPDHDPMLQELARLFAEHEQEGRVSFLYDTEVYYGRVGSTS